MLNLDGLVIEAGDFTLRADWSVPAGARVALIGPSGAGKSTLLGAIAGFVAPARGRILWEGRDLGPLEPGARPVGILFQDQNLFPHLDVGENLGLGISPALRLGPEDRSRIAQALARVGLPGAGGRRPGTLSGGEAARVALARTLLRPRPILLLDEPFAAFGPALKADMLALVDRIATETGALVLLVTHDPGDAKRFAGMCVFVDGGVALPPVPTAHFFGEARGALRAYLGDAP
jgi:thiamine transport system ATP-binding protein